MRFDQSLNETAIVELTTFLSYRKVTSGRKQKRIYPSCANNPKYTPPLPPDANQKRRDSQKNPNADTWGIENRPPDLVSRALVAN